MQSNSKPFENLYYTYSPMLYGIAVQISTSKKQAEQILITTFYKAHQQNIIHTHAHALTRNLAACKNETSLQILKLFRG